MSVQARSDEPVPIEQMRDLALFLDVDGTILDIAPVPEAVVVPPDLRDTLAVLFSGLEGALAVISGRPIVQIDQLLKPLHLPISGEHGFELRRAPEGPVERLDAPAVLGALRPSMTEISRQMLGVLPEFKASTIAMHFRQVPDLAAPLRRLLDKMIAPYEGQITIQPGKMVYEVKPVGVDKGRAIARFMAAAPFAGRHPVFVGDDITDEYGFAVVRELGGTAIRVGSEPHPAADTHLSSPAAVRAWLRRLADVVASPVA